MWKCPKCESMDLRVEVTVLATLDQYEEEGEWQFETDAKGSHEWDGSSYMYCDTCDHNGPSVLFNTKEEECFL